MKQKAKKSESRYLVGYAMDSRTAWGRDRKQECGWVETMPLIEATRAAKRKLSSTRKERVVFKLVPVVKIKGSR